MATAGVDASQAREDDHEIVSPADLSISIPPGDAIARKEATSTSTSAKSAWPIAGGPFRAHIPPWLWYAGAVYTVLVCAGSIFGWVSMSSILAAEGVFASKCGVVLPGGTCQEQQLALSSVYTAASVFSYTVPVPIGIFLDAHGPRKAILLTLGIFTMGPLFIIAAVASGVDELLYPGFIAMGSAASSMLTPLYSVANLFPGWSGLLLAILNGAFDAGSLVYQIMNALHAAGVPLVTIWVAYVAGPVVVAWLIAATLWRNDSFPFPGAPPASTAEPIGEASATTTSEGALTPAQGAGTPGKARGSLEAAASAQSPGERLRSYRSAAGAALSRRLAAATEQTISHPPLVAAAPLARPLSSDAPSAARPLVVASPVGRSSGRAGAASLSPAAALAAAVAAADSPSLAAAVATGGSLHGGRNFFSLSPRVAAAASPTHSAGSDSGVGSLPPLQEATQGDTDAEAASGAPPASGDALSLQQSSASDDPLMLDGGFDTLRLHSLPFTRQLRTLEFLGFAGMFAAYMLRFNVFIGSVHPQMEALNQTDGEYTKLFGTILPLGFFAQFAIGTILDRAGTVAGLWSLWLLAVLFSALNLWAPLAAQPATFLTFAFFR